MGTATASDGSADRGIAAKVWERTGALRAGVIAGAVFGAVFGGVGGRIVMRLIALIDTSTDGAQTDFATVGEMTVGGTFTLLVLSTIAGVIGGVIYVAVRRWLPFSHLAQGAFFGLLMMFGPGVIALGEVDLQIFEPAVPIFAMFVALIVLYGIGVALLTDRLHAPPAARPGPRVELVARSLVGLVAVGICAMAVLVTYNVHDKAGSCLSAGDTGGCAVRVTDR
jgi:hypothetical protein